MLEHCRRLRNLAPSAVILLGLLSAPTSAFATANSWGALTREMTGFLGFGADQANNPTDPTPLASPPPPRLVTREITPPPLGEVPAPPRLPAVVTAAPSVETPLHRLFCVEYARMRSGLAVFGDAKHWWARARNLYGRVSHPVENAVMVFAGSKRLKRGHLAVVAAIIGPRRITVDQANWQNRGEIDHATPVLDVSAANDWSRVRVWDMRSGSFGTHVYAISGFVTKALTGAARD